MFGLHTPYILAAYGVSIVVIGILIAMRLSAFKKAEADENQAETRR